MGNIIELNQQEINCINGGYGVSSVLAIGIVLFSRARGYISNSAVGFLLTGIALANVPAFALFGVVGVGIAYYAIPSYVRSKLSNFRRVDLHVSFLL
jgi:hypothetical protein